MWNWFLGEGDKALAGLTLVLVTLQGTLPQGTKSAAVVTAVLALLHTLVAPAPTATPPASPPK